MNAPMPDPHIAQTKDALEAIRAFLRVPPGPRNGIDTGPTRSLAQQSLAAASQVGGDIDRVEAAWSALGTPMMASQQQALALIAERCRADVGALAALGVRLSDAGGVLQGQVDAAATLTRTVLQNTRAQVDDVQHQIEASKDAIRHLQDQKKGWNGAKNAIHGIFKGHVKNPFEDQINKQRQISRDLDRQRGAYAEALAGATARQRELDQISGFADRVQALLGATTELENAADALASKIKPAADEARALAQTDAARAADWFRSALTAPVAAVLAWRAALR